MERYAMDAVAENSDGCVGNAVGLSSSRACPFDAIVSAYGLNGGLEKAIQFDNWLATAVTARVPYGVL